MLQEMGEHDFSQHIACHSEKGDATTVATVCSVTLLLVCEDNVGIFSLLQATLRRPAVKDNYAASGVKHTPCLMTSAGILSGLAALLSLRLRTAFSTFSTHFGSS